MARPIKRNAEYFSHDADASTDEKLLYLESQFGLIGYALFFKMIETLTRAENFEIDWSDIQCSILARKFGVDTETMQAFIVAATMPEIRAFCINNGKLYSEGLKKRLCILTERREKEAVRQMEKRLLHQQPELLHQQLAENEIVAPTTTQSKVKESKEEELLRSNSVRAREEKISLPAKPSSPTPSSAEPLGDCAAVASNVAPSDDLYPAYQQGGRVYTIADVALTLALSGVPESFVQAAWSHYDAKGWLLSEGVHVANPVSQIRIAWLKPAVKAAIMGEPQSRDAPYSTSYNAQRTPSGTGTQRLPTVQAPANFNQHPVKARVHHVS